MSHAPTPCAPLPIPAPPRALRACLLSVLLMAAGTPWAAPAPIGPGDAEPATSWSLADAKVVHKSSLAARQGERILVWPRGASIDLARVVYFRVDAPFADVQPVLRSALRALGPHIETAESHELAHLDLRWQQVWLSRRPDLRALLAQATQQAKIDKALQEGAVSAAEARDMTAWAQAATAFSGHDMIKLDAGKALTTSYVAVREQQFGFTGASQSRFILRADDVSAVFGRPTTAVSLSRTETYPNPDYKLINLKFDLFSRSEPKYLTSDLVPAAAFEAVSAALKQAAFPVAVASTPLAWWQDVELPRQPAVHLAPPPADTESRVLQPQVFALDKQTVLPDGRGITYPGALLCLPDGDLLVSGGLIPADGSPPRRVWRISRQASELKMEPVWAGASGAYSLFLSQEGAHAWFSNESANQGTDQLLRYDVGTRRLVTAPVPPHPDNGLRNKGQWPEHPWFLDGRQQPAAWTRQHSGDGAMMAWQVDGQAPQGEQWPLTEKFRSSRPAYVQDLMAPVRLRQPGRLWTIDRSLVVWDVASGKVLHSWPVPQRSREFPAVPALPPLHPVDKLDALGSAQGGWVAIPFTYLLQQSAPGVPRLPVPAERTKRGPVADGHYTGLHLMDTSNGQLRLSVLAGAGRLKAVARSAGGRWLAAGGDVDLSQRAYHVWDTRSGRASYRLAAPAGTELRDTDLAALAFSWDGRTIWALYGRQILRWELPAEAADPAAAGSFPDQSRD